ncbi:MAG: hypothetical protein FWE22_06200 [Firmicutes bacterium]|nr:hypothetical protein [Bacillota bacterium]
MGADDADMAMASPLGWLATGAIVAGIGFTQSVGNDLFASGENWSEVNWGRAAVIGAVSGLIAGGGKFVSTNAQFIKALANKSRPVKKALANYKSFTKKSTLGKSAKKNA